MKHYRYNFLRISDEYFRYKSKWPYFFSLKFPKKMFGCPITRILLALGTYLPMAEFWLLTPITRHNVLSVAMLRDDEKKTFGQQPPRPRLTRNSRFLVGTTAKGTSLSTIFTSLQPYSLGISFNVCQNCSTYFCPWLYGVTAMSNMLQRTI